jgi:hypothetical protein
MFHLNMQLFSSFQILPLNILLPKWSEYVSTFLLYLSHQASTVRQAASNIFKYLGKLICITVKSV